MNESAQSILKMKNLRFDEIKFTSHGPDSKIQPKIQFGCKIGATGNGKDKVSVVELCADIKKDNIYDLFVSLIAEFTFDESEPIDDELRDLLLQQNAVAILFPYLRSEISILTAQPNVAPIVIPPLNIAVLFGEDGCDKE